MFWLLTLGCVVAGGLTGRGALRRFLARRRSNAVATDRAGRVLTVAAMLLLLAPDLLPALLSGYPGWGAFFALAVWRAIAVSVLSMVAFFLVLTSRRTRDLARLGVTAATTRLPSATGWRLRREHELPDFPRSWDDLLDYDATLSRRLVSYQHDLELLANRPTMADYSDPHTQAAVAAMTACDRLRTPTPPLTRDVITTDYGRAVAAFAVALKVAEEHAARAVRSGLGVEERERLREAAGIIAFITANATTETDRARAYQRVQELLATEVRGGNRTGTGQHPWLDVEQRADLYARFVK